MTGAWCRCKCGERVELPQRGYAACGVCGTFYAVSTVGPDTDTRPGAAQDPR